MVPEPEFHVLLRPPDPQGADLEDRPTSRSTCSSAGWPAASALLAEGARPCATCRPCERVGRGWRRRAVPAAGTVALVHDLGRPERFLNMLRVFKPTSPLSVGSWILAPFARLRRGGRGLARSPAGCPGWAGWPGWARPSSARRWPPTPAALIANTAVPAWHEAHRELPFVFAGSRRHGGGWPRDDLHAAGAGRAGAPDGGRRRGGRADRGGVDASSVCGHARGALPAGSSRSPDAHRAHDDRCRSGATVARSVAGRASSRSPRERPASRPRCSPGSACSRPASPRARTRSTSSYRSGSGCRQREAARAD